MLNDTLLPNDLTDQERRRFQDEYLAVKKNETTGVLLALFLGGFGAHHFYMGRMRLGILYLLSFWTLIPGIVALAECFLMKGRVQQFNRRKADHIVTRLKMLRRLAARLGAIVSARDSDPAL